MTRVLVIGSETDAMLTEAIAECPGVLLEAAPHGPEALVALATSPARVVFVAMDAPVREGVALARIIRERPANANMVLIALATELSCAEHRALRLAGFDEVLWRPWSAATLKRTLARALSEPERVPSLLEAFARAEALVRGSAWLREAVSTPAY